MVAQEGKIEMLREADRGPRLTLGASWRPENAKSPAAMLQENNPDATCMSIPPIYVPGILLYFCDVCTPMSVSKLDRTLVSRMTNGHGHWVCWMPMRGKNGPHTRTASKQQRGTCG